MNNENIEELRKIGLVEDGLNVSPGCLEAINYKLVELTTKYKKASRTFDPETCYDAAIMVVIGVAKSTYDKENNTGENGWYTEERIQSLLCELDAILKNSGHDYKSFFSKNDINT